MHDCYYLLYLYIHYLHIVYSTFSLHLQYHLFYILEKLLLWFLMYIFVKTIHLRETQIGCFMYFSYMYVK